MSVTPTKGSNTQIVTGGAPVVAAPATLNGGYITNPVLASDQGVATAEPLYVDPATPPSTQANGSTIALQPGDSYALIPNSSTPVYVNAASSGHKFTCVYY